MSYMAGLVRVTRQAPSGLPLLQTLEQAARQRTDTPSVSKPRFRGNLLATSRTGACASTVYRIVPMDRASHRSLQRRGGRRAAAGTAAEEFREDVLADSTSFARI